MTTIKDVAKHAGVSVATVSRTINNSGYVGVESRKKIELAIKELNFYPNEVARSLFQKSLSLLDCCCQIYQTHSFLYLLKVSKIR